MVFDESDQEGRIQRVEFVGLKYRAAYISFVMIILSLLAGKC